MIDLNKLNDKQKEAVLATDGALLIIAGAGSGKTRVLTHRTAYLIEELGINPYNIMAITFTNKAAAEMRERIDAQVGFGAESIWVCTFHSSCVRILRRFADRIGYDTNFTIYDTEDSKQVMKEVCKRLNIDTKYIKEKAILANISKAKDELINPTEYAVNAGNDFIFSRIAAAYREYQDALKKNNAMDFDDLIFNTVELLKHDEEVRNYYSGRFQYIMVDEYQDTNTAQFELVKQLSSVHGNICVVGDDDQSIYKFRGANIGNILNFESHFRNARTIKLEQNYRSTQNILDAANAVIANNKGRKAKALWTSAAKGDNLVFKQLETGYEEAEYVADRISGAVIGGAHYNDHAVLYRTNAQSRTFEEKFIKANIPYKIVGGVNFYARKEIKDILAYLKTIDNGRDDLAVTRIINIPKRGIGATSVSKIQTFANTYGMSFFEAAANHAEEAGLGKAAIKIKDFIDFIRGLRAQTDMMSVHELIEEILDKTGYRAELEAEGTPEADARLENIDELVSKAALYHEAHIDDDDGPTLSGFLEEVALVADIDDVDDDADYVLLMTLHSAKGLEFEHVFLTGMEDGLFPSYMSITSDDAAEEIEEERRLCYVGITRAKNKLDITAARSRMVRGELQFSRVSRFIAEVPTELLNAVDARGKKIKDVAAGSKSSVDRIDRGTLTSLRQKPFGFSGASSSHKPASSFGSGASLAPLDYTEGDRVRHQKFGEGTVVSIVAGGRDYEVTVDFDTEGTKKMFAGFAKLVKQN